MPWIKALRPICGTSTALLVISGFRHANQPIDWIVVATVFFITSMAMIWNDYHDREIDVAKGRFLASKQPAIFLCYALGLATVSLALSLWVLFQNVMFGSLCLGMWVASMLYNKAQSNPFAKNVIVSLNVAATVTFPLFLDTKITRLWFMAAYVFVVISIREYIKDVEDMEVDRDRKLTLALVLDSRISDRSATYIRHLMSLLLVALMV